MAGMEVYFFKSFKRIVVASGPLSLIAVEAGWWFAEVGRQPWILRGYMKTAEAATTSGQVDIMLILFAGLYIVLAIGSIVVLVRMFRNNPIELEMEEHKQVEGCAGQ